MKVSCGRIVMNKAIDLVSSALPSKDYGDATSGIMLVVEEKNADELILVANSLEVFIRTKIKMADKGTPGVVVPNGNIITKVVENLKNMKNPIIIDYNDKDNILNLSCGKEYDGSIAHYDSVGFYVPITKEEIEKLPAMSIPARFIKKALDEIAFSCSKDKTHANLTGIFFDQDKDGMTIVGSDSLRMSAIQLKSKIERPQSTVLNTNHLGLLKKILGLLEVDDSKIVKLHIDDSMAYFVYEDTVFGMQTHGKSYYDAYKQFIVPEEKCAISMVVNRESFISLLDLAISHNSSSQETVVYRLDSVKKGVLESRASSSDGNVNAFSIPFDVVKVEVPAGEKAKKVSVAVNPQFFLDVLSRLKEKEVKICLVKYGDGPIAVYPIADGASGKYVHVFSITD